MIGKLKETEVMGWAVDARVPYQLLKGEQVEIKVGDTWMKGSIGFIGDTPYLIGDVFRMQLKEGMEVRL